MNSLFQVKTTWNGGANDGLVMFLKVATHCSCRAFLIKKMVLYFVEDARQDGPRYLSQTGSAVDLYSAIRNADACVKRC